MQHVEEAGIHSGDSACVLPPHALGERDARRRSASRPSGIARALGVVGLLNVQFAIHGDERLHVIEANPRASRTVPFVSKAIGLPVAKLACRIMLGERIADLDLPADTSNDHVCVKEAVLPFDRFAGADSLLGPEMRSTGEVMGIARDFPTAFAKAQAAAGARLPSARHRVHHRRRRRQAGGDRDRDPAARPRLQDHRHPRHGPGDPPDGDPGRADQQDRRGLARTSSTGSSEGEVDLVINTPVGTGARTDGYEIRSAAVARGIPCITTMSGGMAAARAIAAERRGEPRGDLAPGAPRANGSPRSRERARSRPRSAGAQPDHRARGARRLRRPTLRRPGRSAAAGRTVLHAHRGQAVGRGEAERPFLPRAFSVLRAPAGTDELQFLLEDVGPGTNRLCELGPGDDLLIVGPLGSASPPRARDGGRCSSAAGSGSRRWRSGRTSSRRRRRRSAGLPRRCPGRRGAQLLRRPDVATDDGSVGHHGLVTDLLAEALDDDPDTRRSTRAGRRRCSRRSGRCAPSVRSPHSSRWSPGMACGFGACFGCVVPTRAGYLRLCVDGPVLDAEILESAAVAGAGH